jgi:hypothetical protein
VHGQIKVAQEAQVNDMHQMLRINHCTALLCHILYCCNLNVHTGGDLVDRQRIRTENDAAAVVKAIVDGIRYCHDHHIAVSTTAQQLTLYVLYCSIVLCCSG